MIYTTLQQTVGQAKEAVPTPAAWTEVNTTADQRCDHIWGLSKLTWVLICDVLALTVLMLCIPFLLQVSRRRPYGAPLLDFGHTKTAPGSPHADFLCCIDGQEKDRSGA
eukprot:symbB.v1.2.014692.t1/scaffold1076.1/size139817/3